MFKEDSQKIPLAEVQIKSDLKARNGNYRACIQMLQASYGD